MASRNRGLFWGVRASLSDMMARKSLLIFEALELSMVVDSERS